MGSARLTNGLMTAVSNYTPVKNYDYQSKSGVRKGSPGDVYAYLYFPRPFPIGATIISAKLHFWAEHLTKPGTGSLTVTPLGQSVSFSRVTFVTRPQKLFGGAKTVSKTGPQSGRSEWVVDVTSHMASVSAGQAWYGWQFSTSNLNPLVYIYGPTYGTAGLRPWIEVEWSDAPKKPTGLAPSGGRAVSLAKPTVRANYIDVAGSVVLEAVQVQTSTTDSFTSPTWDSGTVLTSASELDLNETSFPGLADGQVVYWRIRMQDGAGLWSVWSDAATFKRDIEGTLTVENPSESGLSVTDVTPPIYWTFTGETQSAWQIHVWERYDAANPNRSRPMKTTGKVSGTETAYTLPKGWLTEANQDYNLAVKVWDTKNREAVANNPAYVRVDRVFKFTPSTAIAGITSLWATPDAYKPEVVLTWSRSFAPDAFNVLRNGKVVAAGLDPLDLTTGATSYTYRDLGPSPQRDVKYQVQAVENGKASATNATVTTRLLSVGVWLRDPISGESIVLAGRDSGGFTFSENTSVIEPIADGAPKVLITQAQGLLEGTITGSLVTGVDNRTAEALRDAFLRMRVKAGSVFYLTKGDYTMQVVARNFTYAQRVTSVEKIYDISFEFYQQGDLSDLSTGF